MREALLKKRYGIPAALLILLVLAGVATAALVTTFKYSITTQEPLTFTKCDGLDITYQGESDDIIVQVQNLSTKQGYGILVDATVKDDQFDSISYSTQHVNGTSTAVEELYASEPDSDGNFGNDGDTYDAQYNIEAGETFKIVVTVDSADDADSGGLEVDLSFQREATYSHA